MAEEFGLHPLAVEDARKGHQRPKIEEYDESLFVVLHTIEASSAEADAPLTGGEVDIFVGAQLHPVGAPPHREGLRRGPRPLRARTRAAAARIGLRAVRADGHRRRPLLSDPRRASSRSSRQIEEQIFVRNAARSNIESLYALKQKLMIAEARGRPADGGDRQALRRPRAAGLHRHAGILPRRVRPPAPDPRDDRGHPRNADDGDPGQSRHDLAVRERGDQEARRLGRHHRRADDGRRHLRDELQVHARARLGVRLPACARGDGRGGHLPLRPLQEGPLAVAAASDERGATRQCSRGSRRCVPSAVARRRHRDHPSRAAAAAARPAAA